MPVSPRKSKSISVAVPRNACTCGSLRKASRRVSQFYDTALAPIGIKSTQFSILAEVDRGERSPECEAGGPVPRDAGDLARRVDLAHRERAPVHLRHQQAVRVHREHVGLWRREAAPP